MKDLASNSTILDFAKNSIITQSESIRNLTNLIEKSFSESVKLIYNSSGRVVITGVGKSAIIANKIVATLNSTGTPSIFMHAADANHGDIGIIKKNDIVICVSKSGNTGEIKSLIPLIQNNNKLIAITGNPNSFLAKNADYFINSMVKKEVCPNNLAPTTSTTAQLVIGDALAVCLLNLRKFSKEDFAKYHPGGTLGKKLSMKIKDIIVQNQKPEVKKLSNIKEVIFEISSKRLGVTAVIEKDKIIGIITDGDLRRMLEKTNNISNLTAFDIMSKKPKTIDHNAMATEALVLMERHSISQILVEENKVYKGVIHMHDLIREGII